MNHIVPILGRVQTTASAVIAGYPWQSRRPFAQPIETAAAL